MSKYKVIFDTNSIRNEKLNTFFGKYEELTELSVYADIIIPDLVYQEISSQKKRTFEINRKNIKSNHLFRISDFDEKNIVNIDDKIQELEGSIGFAFEKITIENHSQALEFITNKAVNKEAPFVSDNGSDKGFKDCHIVYSIKEFFEKNKNTDCVFIVCSEDTKFKKAIEEISKDIKIISKIEDVKTITIDQYKDDYFIEKLKEHFEVEKLNTECIKDMYSSYDYEDILRVEVHSKIYLVKISEREIIKTELEENIEKSIESFELSPNFIATHERLIDLNEFIDFFGKNHITSMFEAINNNDQIYSIVDDEDMTQFLVDIKEFTQEHIEEDLYKKYIYKD